jgi:uncharacterized protein
MQQAVAAFADDLASDVPGAPVIDERRASNQPDERTIGTVVFCDGSRAIISTPEDATHGQDNPCAVGRLITINLGSQRIVAAITAVEAEANRDSASMKVTSGFKHTFVSVDLTGEIWERDGRLVFTRGVSSYPAIGAVAHRIRAVDLAAVFAPPDRSAVAVGRLSQDQTIRAAVSVDELLSKHFSVLGSTGVGKSNSVALILHQVLRARPNLRVLLMDPHNEYASSFHDMSEVVNPDDFSLPFWLFRLEEISDVIGRGRPLPDDEFDLLSDLIPVCKARYASAAEARVSGSALRKESPEPMNPGFTGDTPVPYRMSDLLAAIEERLGALEQRNDRQHLKNLKFRIRSVVNDPRYRFMFAQRTIEDTMEEILGRLFRIPMDGKPITIIQLAGFPSEMVSAMVSVLCRLAFDIGLFSNGSMPLLVVCEEAHRYVPADRDAGFLPARRAIARIAREGRKYGVHLGVITQRPSELDPTVLSQCSTVFAMRLANEGDKAIIRNAISDAAASALTSLSALTIGEAIAFGEGIPTPMRLRFTMMPPDRRPKSNISAMQEHAFGTMDKDALSNIIGRLRAAHRNRA